MSITEETRRESYERINKTSRQTEILEAWEGSMTARDIKRKLGYVDMNSVRPRITELVALGFLVADGKVYDAVTSRYVASWRKV